MWFILGRASGVVSDERWHNFLRVKEEVDRAEGVLKRGGRSPHEWEKLGVAVQRDGTRRSAYDLIRLPGFSEARLRQLAPELKDISHRSLERVVIEAQYRDHLKRQADDVRAFMADEMLSLDPNLDYDLIPNLSAEVRDRLRSVRPVSVGAAKRMEGMTPTSLVQLLRHARRASTVETLA
ncbi:Mitochondrial Translation Optimization [Tulasnella sp. 403]|nr:Mitochondrial Translation Optimization [Tulasnella sp. 403]